MVRFGAKIPSAVEADGKALRPMSKKAAANDAR